jgi:hypothetical protein
VVAGDNAVGETGGLVAHEMRFWLTSLMEPDSQWKKRHLMGIC